MSGTCAGGGGRWRGPAAAGLLVVGVRIRVVRSMLAWPALATRAGFGAASESQINSTHHITRRALCRIAKLERAIRRDSINPGLRRSVRVAATPSDAAGRLRSPVAPGTGQTVRAGVAAAVTVAAAARPDSQIRVTALDAWDSDRASQSVKSDQLLRLCYCGWPLVLMRPNPF